MKKIFVSHSSKDREVVTRLVDLMILAGLPTEGVFCTSAEDSGVQTGEQFINSIANELKNCDLVILLLSPNYYASTFCLAEMGGAWAVAKNVFPFVLSGTPRDPGVVFANVHSQRLDSEGLDALHERLVDGGFIPHARTRKWSAAKGAFLAELTGLVAALPKPNLVRREELDAEAEKARGAYELISDLNGQLRDLRERYDKVRATKDRVEVEAIELAHLNTKGQYERLLDAAQKQLKPLTPVVIRAIYATIADSPWLPDDEWSRRTEVQSALNSGHIVREDEGYLVATEDPKILRALDALHALDDLLQREDALPLLEHLEREHDCAVGVARREFVEKAILHEAMID